MKVIVYGTGSAPEAVRRVQTEQTHDPIELREAIQRLSGSMFVIVVLSLADQHRVLEAATKGHPEPIVVLPRGSQLLQVLGAGRYWPYLLPAA